MSEERENSPSILHVDTGGSPPANLDRWLASAPFAIETVSDVYRGLARALASPDRELQAVIVGADNLASAEFEFFSILERLRPTALICIYGSESQRAEIKSVIRADRLTDLSRDGLDALRRLAITCRIESRTVPKSASVTTEKSTPPQKTILADEIAQTTRMENVQAPTVSIPAPNPVTVTQTTPDPKFSSANINPKTETPQVAPNKIEHIHIASESGTNGKDHTPVASVSISSNIEHEKVMDLREDEEPEDCSPDLAGDSTSPARVPWRTYSDAPPRVAPQRIAPRNENFPPASATPMIAEQPIVREQPMSATPVAPISSRPIEPSRVPPLQRQSFTEDRYAPLLTPEELQALMADDEEVESLTVEETDALLSDEE